MRLFLWSLIFTVILLVGFAQVVTPFIKHKSVEHKLPIHKTLYVERYIEDDELFYIFRATMEWNKVTNGQVTFDIKRLPQREIMVTDAIVVVNVSPDYPEVIMLDASKNQKTLGYCNMSGLPFIALIPERLDDKIYTQVMLHELGHSLGLEHVEGDAGIGMLMYPTVEHGSLHITDGDLFQLCMLYHCDPRKFHGVDEN
jgi:hypothetical protein